MLNIYCEHMHMQGSLVKTCLNILFNVLPVVLPSFLLCVVAVLLSNQCRLPLSLLKKKFCIVRHCSGIIDTESDVE